MSEIRLITVEKGKASSGHIPSSSIPAIMWAISEGACDTDSLWEKLEKMDPGLKEHFLTNRDDSPLLEGFDDGLLVISWDHKCIESFQGYQPLRFSGKVVPHNGRYLEIEQEETEYHIDGSWSIIDHHFEESRH
ncbi:MAG: hypothetical protein Kow0029_29570 [Candidatus Rifleibacteriota bacterium]